jgi:carbamoyltransferase
MARRSAVVRPAGRDVAVLGISAQYHDSAAALVVNGTVVAAAQEERFTRVKGDASMPRHAIEYVLRAGGLQPADLTTAVFYESPFAKFDRLLSTKMLGNVRALPTFVHSMSSWLPNKLWVAREIAGVVGKEVPVMYGDHHLSHAAAAFYPSPFEHAAILTVDGVGEWTTTSIAEGNGSSISMLEQVEYPNSLGLLYSAFTRYCGFKVNSGEYKLMGLAPYGTPRFTNLIFSELISLASDGSFSLNPRYFEYLDTRQTYGAKFESLFGAPSRGPDDDLTPFHADIAASIQEVTDTVMLALARRAKDRTGAQNLCLSGGVALNVVSVGAIERSGVFSSVWVQPAAGDAGSALGAALWASFEQLGIPRTVDPSDMMRGGFLGPVPGEMGISSADTIAGYGLVARRLDDVQLAGEVAGHVASGKVVAVARGRMEFGPRALGNRSILADARDPQMQLRLNLKTKFREGFRPFAPVVLESDADQFFEMGASTSPYMLKTFYVRDSERRSSGDGTNGSPATNVYEQARAVRSTIPAVTHVDHSARVQTVDQERHPFLHEVLTCFKKSTGCPVMVNTSFNVRGEPIVASATDAIECFLHTDIDVLVLDEYIIVRSEQESSSLVPARRSARGED